MSISHPITGSFEKLTSPLGNDSYIRDNKYESNIQNNLYVNQNELEASVPKRLDIMVQKRRKEKEKKVFTYETSKKIELDPERMQFFKSSDTKKYAVVTPRRLGFNSHRTDLTKTQFPKASTPMTLENLENSERRKSLPHIEYLVKETKLLPISRIGKKVIEDKEKTIFSQKHKSSQMQPSLTCEKITVNTLATSKKLDLSKRQLEKGQILERKKTLSHKSFSHIVYPVKEVENPIKRLASDVCSDHMKNSFQLSLQSLEDVFSEQEETIEQKNVGPYPLYTKVDTKVLQSKLSYLMAIQGKNFFNQTAAAKELSQCIQSFPTQYKDIQNILKEKQTLLNGSYLKRLYNVFRLALPKFENATFLSFYFSHTSNIDVDAFARIAISKLIRKKTADDIIELLTLYTKVDLALQIDDRDTLFRHNWLSSSLCQEYAFVIWRTEIERFCGIIADELRVSGDKLCLEQNQIQENLKLKNSKFSQLKIKEQGRQISRVLYANQSRFVKLLRSLIPVMHGMYIPSELLNLFKMRRQLISNSLKVRLIKGESLKDVSRIYTSELVFSRLINPAILSIPNQEFASVKINIAKMIQNLANEVRPENDMLAEILMPIYDDFISANRKFLDTHSL